MHSRHFLSRHHRKMVLEINSEIPTVASDRQDEILIIGASWEERCLGLARKLGEYRSDCIILNVYDAPSQQRAKHLDELLGILNGATTNLSTISANRQNSLSSV